MSDPEIEWKIEEKSTTPSTESDGSEAKPESAAPWEINVNDSEKEVDTFFPAEDDGPKCVGEIRIELFEDETVRVSVPNLGRWTPGRVEKAIPRLFREIIQERQRAMRVDMGLPADFVIGSEGESNG